MKSFTAEYLQDIAFRVFQACGTPAPEAEIVASHLATANLMGLDSHGIIRVPQYVHDIREGTIVPGAPIELRRETATTAIVDAGWNFGQIGATRATEAAMRKAKASAVSCVVLRRARHVGCLGAYPRLAAQHDFVSIAMCGSAGEGHWVCPWGGLEGRVSTNPIAFAAPTGGNPIVLDFATSMASEGKVRLKLNRGESLPEGWLIDASGQGSTDPRDLYTQPRGAILPIGGPQGYKGFALSLMVQILSGVLGDPAWRKEGLEAHANVMWLLVIDIGAFLPPEQFRSEMDALIQYEKSSPPAPGCGEILMPGELDFRGSEKRKVDGICVEEETWRQIEQVASELGVDL